MTLKVVVVDDEKVARQRVSRLVEETGEADVVAECVGGREAIEAIERLRPDLVFLDIQMPDVDGFAVLEALGPESMPATVFITAFDQHAVKAFEVHAVDYLLKPYDAERFHDAFERAKQRLRERDRSGEEERFRELLRSYLGRGPSDIVEPNVLDRVAVKVDGAIRILRTADVWYWEAEGNYVRATTAAGSHLIRGTISGLESRLDPRQFVRIHRRYIVNLDRIHEVQPWFAGDSIVLLHGGPKLRLARSYRARLHARLLGAKGSGSE